MIPFILKFNCLAALTIMSVCPVCKYQHYEEVSKCPRCNWSMQDNFDFVEINPEHPILRICITALVNRLEEETRSKNNLLSHIQTLDPDHQKVNNQKLDGIIDAIEDNKQQYLQEIKTLTEQVTELKSLVKNRNNDSNVEIETINSSTITEDIQTVSAMEDDENNSIFTESDRNINNDFNPINEPPEGSLYDKTGDRNINNDSNSTNEPSEDTFYEVNDSSFSNYFNNQANIKPENNSNGSYQSFYRLIKNGELEITKVAVPQETVENIRGGTQSEFKFVNDRKGNYWIVNWHNVYCLIPKEKTYINQHQYGNFQRVFECQNYQETYSDFEVVEPATVFKIDNETWQLERKGKIKFI